MSREDFHRARRLGIGGSDAPIVLGMNPSRSPLDLYAEKIGAPVVDRLADREEVEIGARSEEHIGRLYTWKTGRRLRRRRAQVVHPARGWQRAHLDREIDDDNRGRGVLEIKNRDRSALKTWESNDDPVGDRARTLVQLLHNMETARRSWGAIAVLFGGNKFRIYEYERADFREVVELIVERERAFWNAVVRREPPPLSNPFADALAISALHPAPRAWTSTALDAEVAEYDRIRRGCDRQIAALKRTREEASNRIKIAIGNHARGDFADGSGYTYLAYSRTTTKKLAEIAPSLRKRVSKTRTYRELRYVPKRKK